MSDKMNKQKLFDFVNDYKIYNNVNGYLEQRMGLYIELYFHDAFTEEKAKNILSITKSFYEEYKGILTHYLPPTGSKNRKLKDEFPSIYKQHIEKRIPDGYTSARIFCSGDEKTDGTIPTHSISYAIEPKGDPIKYSGSLNIYLPIEELNNMSHLIEKLIFYCDHLQVKQGYCGITPILDIGSIWRASNYKIFPLLKRYKGIDMGDISAGPSFELRAYNLKRRIEHAGVKDIDELRQKGRDEGYKSPLQHKSLLVKPLSWITIMDNELVNDLSGIENIEKKLIGENKFYQWSSGIVLQATNIPQLIDVNYGENNKEYNNMAQILKSIRLNDTYTNKHLFFTPEGLDDKEESIKWIQRFDEKTGG